MANTAFLSLFSGAMGLDLGLEEAGFKSLACNEIDERAIETIRRNRPRLPTLARSVAEVDADALKRIAGQEVSGIDLLAGGPPCQAFSVFGKRKGVEDERGRLLYEFIRLVGEVRPKVFLMENVRGLHSMPIAAKGDREKTAHGSLLRDVFRRFEAIGYRVDAFLVNAANYGAPQIRERLLCIGNRFGLRAEFPAPRFSNRPADGLPAFRTLGDAIGPGFIDPDPDCMDFSERKLKYLAMIPPGGNWRSLPVDIQKESMGKAWFLKGGRSAYWRRLSFDFPCPTVVTMPNHAGTSMCHPTATRALTVGELAAVQEFPAGWRFSGSATDKCRQIGNAVPVRLGLVAGEAVKELLGRIAGAGTGTSAAPSSIQHLRPHVRTRTFWKKGSAYAGKSGYYDETPEDCRQGLLFDADGPEISR